MKNFIQYTCLVLFSLSLFSCNNDQISEENNRDLAVIKKKSKELRIADAIKENEEKIKDPALGRSTSEEMVKVYDLIKKKAAARKTNKNLTGIEELVWKERGPYSVGGRTRAILVDQNDPTNNTVWTAGVSGGLWKTESIKSNPPNWEPINDNFDNLAICAIAQDPNNPDIMYFGTGEPHAGLAVSGLGIWKSVDGGDTWDNLPSTSTPAFRYIARLLIHPNGDVYAVTVNGGLIRSQDGGLTWPAVLSSANGGKNDMTDIELAADGTLFASGGHAGGNGAIWKSPAGNAVGDIGTWTPIMNGLPSDLRRIELATAPSNEAVIYCVVTKVNTVFSIYVSTNYGNSWSPKPLPQNGYSTGQAWYDLCITVDPNDHTRLITGNFLQFMSVNSGTTWTNISAGIHVDQHFILYEPGNSNVVYLGNDGGIYRSDNAGGPPTTVQFYNRNARYNVTQYYACDLHPDAYSNYFLAGSQDNGTHSFSKPGLGTTRHSWGGDGAFCHIDQNEPQYQIVSSQFGNYVLSSDGGLTFSAGSVSVGVGFINDSDYDDDANILYAFGGGGRIFRWDITQQDGESVGLSGSSQAYRHITCSPNVPNRIYLGSTAGTILIVDNAHQGTTMTGTSIVTSNLPIANVSDIVIEEGNESHIIVTFSNYGTKSVFETTDAGQTWVDIEGNLPNMPVRSALLNPIDSSQLFLATEAGIWVTNKINGANTEWEPSFSAPFVRTDMLQYRKSDNLIIVGTYGRGLWSCDGFSPPFAAISPEQVTYLGVNKFYEDLSVNATTWAWDFGDGTTAATQDVTHSYSQIGTYTVSLTIDNGLADSKQVKVLPDRATPYAFDEQGFAGDFESQPEDFGAHNISGTPFQKGRSTKQGKSGTNSGNNAWVIGLNDDFYEPNTHAVLYTPNYDISDQGIYELSYFAKYDIQQGFDGFLLEYSLDKGITWNPLGTKRSGWYNYSNVDASAPTSFPTGTEYFTGTTVGNEFKEFRYNLKEFEAEDQIAFRFVFRTDGSTKYPGLALDDIQVKAVKADLATKLISFTGSYLSYDEVELNWVTFPEYRCKGFEIEVSENGRDFEKVNKPTFVNATGYTIEETGYLVTPEQEFKRDEHYFRIKVIDFNGEHFYSDILPLRRETDGPKAVYLTFPNPVTDHVNITFNDLITEEEVLIEMFDAVGRKVLSLENPEINDVTMKIELPSLADGVYFLKVLIGKERYVTKLQKN